ncbi:MAG TPA: IclR family transcriptional regulator [Candidatus Limnocylindrales bacterium]
MSRVQSIERAFAVLSALGEGPLGVTEIADRVGLPKSTVARLLATLAGEGAVEQIAAGTDYRIGARLATLAASVLPTRNIVALAHPELVDLARRCGEATGLSILDGTSVHYVDQVETPNPVRVRDWTGTRAPLHAVPSGIVLLASLPDAAVARYLERPLERFTSRTVTTAAVLRERVAAATRDGFAWGIGEYAEGINSIAAPVADAHGEMVAAVHVHGPTYRFPAAGAEEVIEAEIVASAARVSARLRASAMRDGQPAREGDPGLTTVAR